VLRRRRLLDVDNICFSDEKIFTVQPPINTQNDRVYAAASKKSSVASRRQNQQDIAALDHKHFSESVMVSVAVGLSKADRIHPQQTADMLLGHFEHLISI